MAVLWQSSGVPFIDPNGDPYDGALAFFYASGTTTPLTTYSEGGLSLSNANPVVANSSGIFPAIFLPPTTYKVQVTNADQSVVIFEADGVDAPQAASFVPPDAGSTDTTLLFSTGDVLYRYATGSHAGWVRCAGLTMGNAASGATERANADTSCLFQHLWAVDATLAVSGGRGGTADGDFAAGKTIALPDGRSRAPIALASMGNSNVGLIADAQVDGSKTADTLGATAGEAKHQILTAEMPSHNHALTDPGHVHSIATGSASVVGGSNPIALGGPTPASTGNSHTGITLASAGSDTAHNNIQPSIFLTMYLKL